MELIEPWKVIIGFFDQPTVRGLTTIIAIVSAVAGLYVAFRAQRLLRTQEKEVHVTQEQSLNDQWQKIRSAMLANERLLQTVSSMVGAEDIEHFRRITFLQILANVLYQAWVSMDRGTLDKKKKVYEAHFISAARYFHNRRDLFFHLVSEGEYPRAFIRDCERRFDDLKLAPLTQGEMRRESCKYANLFDQADGSNGQGDGMVPLDALPNTDSPPVHRSCLPSFGVAGRDG